ncbi:MAG: bis(5'-nucleosyl)-tetraphosphatase [Acutalibacter sp.]
MKKEKSCGAVVYRLEDGCPEVLLIKHRNGGHWAFPKGHVEKNETESETALREIREETGLAVDLDTGFRETVTYSPKPGVMKDVIYFSAKVKSNDARPQPEEVLELRWENQEQALALVTYATDRSVLQSFFQYYQRNSEA